MYDHLYTSNILKIYQNDCAISRIMYTPRKFKQNRRVRQGFVSQPLVVQRAVPQQNHLNEDPPQNKGCPPS